MRYLATFLMTFALFTFVGCSTSEDSCCNACVDGCTCNVEDGNCCCGDECTDICDCEGCDCKS